MKRSLVHLTTKLTRRATHRSRSTSLFRLTSLVVSVQSLCAVPVYSSSSSSSSIWSSVTGSIMDHVKTRMVTADLAIAGSDEPTFTWSDKHAALKGHSTVEPFPEGTEQAVFGLGCFWGAERLFWKLTGVYSTQVGYAGGFTKNPTYEQVCTGRTGHTEVVRVVYDPKTIGFETLLQVFWEAHNPTEGMRQGADVGTQYRSCIYYYTDAQKAAALQSKDEYQKELSKTMEFQKRQITTEIEALKIFYYAEDYHQQYLHKKPHGYCGLKGTGVSCPLPASKGTSAMSATSATSATSAVADPAP